MIFKIKRSHNRFVKNIYIKQMESVVLPIMDCTPRVVIFHIILWEIKKYSHPHTNFAD